MKVVALAGGVGGARMVDGLSRVLDTSDLTVIVNTGDDFTHLTLRICPDLDTVCYMLAGLSNPDTGWGRVGDSWNALQSVVALGGPGWFNLGDRDFGTHLERTHRLALGEPLHKIVADFCSAWGVKPTVLPMTNDPFETWVDTHEFGWLAFQEYFVKYQCKPTVKGFRFVGAEKASPAPGVIEAIDCAETVVVCPSNPWVSITPILRVPGVMESICKKTVVVAVSPIVGGKAIKGPAAKMYRELGLEPSALQVAQTYLDWIDGMVIDLIDYDQKFEIERLGLPVEVTDTVMVNEEKRIALARATLQFASKLMSGGKVQ